MSVVSLSLWQISGRPTSVAKLPINRCKIDYDLKRGILFSLNNVASLYFIKFLIYFIFGVIFISDVSMTYIDIIRFYSVND